MSSPVDLLLITWNRREYVERTLENLLSSDDNFRLYCWDNGSKDGAADIISEARDERIVERHFSPVNVMQRYPTEWFLEKSKNEIIGKVDDDTLVPQGWIEKISPLVSEYEKVGMVGCWTFWPEDYERNKEFIDREKIVIFGNHSLIHNITIGGTAFLVRKKLALDYFDTNHDGTGFPINRLKMTIDGFYSGWYNPLIWAEHMDDPRSEHCLMNKTKTLGANAALTSKTRNIKDAGAYLDWIKLDADTIMSYSVDDQIKRRIKQASFSYKLLQRIKAKLVKK